MTVSPRVPAEPRDVAPHPAQGELLVLDPGEQAIVCFNL